MIPVGDKTVGGNSPVFYPAHIYPHCLHVEFVGISGVSGIVPSECEVNAIRAKRSGAADKATEYKAIVYDVYKLMVIIQ